ncbi:hypothetical protein diail_9636 [Diaporthe ilicicola]|nr:hypothetical protein diail_9636 [Diaporthe ilicicola]
MYTERCLQLKKHRGGLLALAWAMEQERHDELQSRWLAKAYLFSCDFIPQCLTGAFSHISGNDTMEALLSHGDPRPRATRWQSGPTPLEKRMGTWETWEEAEVQRAVTKKKVSWTAPGLLSPEVFSPSEPRESQVPLLADYDGLLGADFLLWPEEHTTLAPVVGHSPVRLADDDAVLTLWCQHWNRRADQAANLPQQITARELLAHSLRWLSQVGHPPKEAFEQSLELLYAFPKYTAFREAVGQLARHASRVSDPAAKSLVTRIMMAQTCYFHSLSLSSHFSQVKRCIVWEHLRVCVVLQNLPESGSSAAQRWRARHDLLLRNETIAAIQLTSWQLLALLFPGADCGHAVTKCQAWHFWQVMAPDSPSPANDPRLYNPVPVATTTVPTGGTCKKHPALQKLLGDLVVQDASTAHLLTRASSMSFSVSRQARYPTLAVVPLVAESTSPATAPNVTGPTASAATPDQKKPFTDWEEQPQDLVEASAFFREELVFLRADVSSMRKETGTISPYLATQIVKLQEHLE